MTGNAARTSARYRAEVPLRCPVSLATVISAVVSIAISCAVPTEGKAVVIVRNFVPDGAKFPKTGLRAGPAPTTVAGGGNLEAIFNAAADWWEISVPGTHTVTLDFGWSPKSGPILASHNTISQGGTPHRETQGRILFDNDGSSRFFMDATPYVNEEFVFFNSSAQDLGAGALNVGHVYSGYTGPLVNGFTPIDIFAVASHEIAHALGLSSGNTAYQNESWPDNDVDVTAPLPFAGSSIPTNNGSVPEAGPTSNAHIGPSITTALMSPSISAGIRRLLSSVDILANAEISEFGADLSPTIEWQSATGGNFENDGAWLHQPSGAQVVPNPASTATFDLAGTYTVNLNSDYVIGALSGSNAGTTLNLNANSLSVGDNNVNTTFSGAITGTGALEKVGSATWTLTGANTTGSISVDEGTLAIAGGSLAPGNASIGSPAGGALIVENGGSFATSQGSIGSSPGSNGSVTVLGSGSIWTDSLSIFVGGSSASPGGTGLITVGSGGTVDVTLALKIWNDGTVNLDGGTINAPLVDVTVGTLSGSGLINGNVTNAGLVAPGASPGVINVVGDYTQTAAGVLNVDIDGLLAGTEHDQVNVSATANLDGALFANMGFTPAHQDSFQVMTFGSRSGVFSSVTDSGLPDMLVMAPFYTATDLTLSVELLGDINGDGMVSAADYTLWANNFGMAEPSYGDGDLNRDGMVSAADYTLWANKFGAVAMGPESSSAEGGIWADNFGVYGLPSGDASAAVPEPSALVLLVLGLLSVVAFRARPRLGGWWLNGSEAPDGCVLGHPLLGCPRHPR